MTNPAKRPVAWQMRFLDPVSPWRECSEHYARDPGENVEIRPLYAHPASPAAPGVSDAMVEAACQAMWPSWATPRLRNREDRAKMHAVLTAALGAQD